VSVEWESEFRERMRRFTPPRDGDVAVSLKVRVISGCFHREHSPQAYALIDERQTSLPDDGARVEFVEHESGPELLVALDLTAAGLALTASVISLVVAILDARRKGVGRGDQPSAPVELVVRRIDYGDTFREERVLSIASDESVDPAQVEALLRAMLDRGAGDETESAG
jgi:hypothetical protein